MKYIPYVIIAVLVCVILSNRRDVEIRETCTTDTVSIFVTDTVRELLPLYEREIQLEEVTITGKKENIKIPITQKYYHGENYEAWVSGYRPSLDSIKTYNKVEYRTVTNDITKYVSNNKNNVYLEGGFKAVGASFMPELGISINTKNRVSYGANIGVFEKHPVFGIKLGIKIK